MCTQSHLHMSMRAQWQEEVTHKYALVHADLNITAEPSDEELEEEQAIDGQDGQAASSSERGSTGVSRVASWGSTGRCALMAVLKGASCP